MALRGKEVRPLIGDSMHERLAIMAEFRELQIAELAARLGKRWKGSEEDQGLLPLSGNKR